LSVGRKKRGKDKSFVHCLGKRQIHEEEMGSQGWKTWPGRIKNHVNHVYYEEHLYLPEGTGEGEKAL